MTARRADRPNSDALIVFLHIPRAGGSTLRGILRRHYRSNELLSIERGTHPKTEIATLPKSRREAIRCVFGHVYYGIHEYFERPAVYVAFMRDPVDRVVSLYHYIRGLPAHPLHRVVVSGEMSLFDFVDSGLSPETSNGQTRQIRGLPANDTLTQRDLDLAKANLERDFPLVGLVERYNESLVLARHLLGWRNLLHVPRNVTSSCPSINTLPGETLDVILGRNQLDGELYLFVQQRLEEAGMCYGPTLAADVRRFDALNSAYGRFSAVAKSIGAPLAGFLGKP